MTGSLGDALQAGTIAFATAKAFEAVGNHREMGVDSAGNTIYRSGWEAGSTRTVLAHGAVGGLSAKASGGQFRQGFMSSGFSAAMGPSLPQGNTVAAYASRMAVGGTASRLAGGSFANGAKTAAYGYMFNEMGRHSRKGCSGQMCKSASNPSVQERRNAINDEWIAENIPNQLNVTDEHLTNAGFGGPEPANRTKFHNNWFGFRGNRKYVHPKGYEIVLDVNNALVTHPAVMGTYNYGHNGFDHFFLDIVPYYIHGNSAADSTTLGQRLMKGFE